ncbi:hypothetical protein [Mesobacillus foraminis]|uniref:hypothetical protein n=1 Tax=Mesobacillus foraminis TaxID=279826 RepID=UPI000EF47AAA|nr:hypothetical protein [Mesobacillus foraminis]
MEPSHSSSGWGRVGNLGAGNQLHLGAMTGRCPGLKESATSYASKFSGYASFPGSYASIISVYASILRFYCKTGDRAVTVTFFQGVLVGTGAFCIRFGGEWLIFAVKTSSI